MKRVIIVLALLGLFGISQMKTMEKDREKKVWGQRDQKETPLLGASGPFGGSNVDSVDKTTLQASFAEDRDESISDIVGRLSIFAVRDPKSFFEGLKEPDHYLDIDLNGDEWAALFYDVLKCPKATVEPFSPGDDAEQWRKRYRLKFQESMPNYPLLGRIWDIYEYGSYRPNEIAQLREECLRIQNNTSNEKALAALTKLVTACDEASKNSSGLLFVPD